MFLIAFFTHNLLQSAQTGNQLQVHYTEFPWSLAIKCSVHAFKRHFIIALSCKLKEPLLSGKSIFLSLMAILSGGSQAIKKSFATPTGI